jgi:serine/threonine-protein kinase
MTADDDSCPDCGSRPPANAPDGLCPHCLLGLGLGVDLVAGAGDGRDGGPAPGRGAPSRPASGVLKVLDRSIGPVPRVLLRDAAEAARPDRPGPREPADAPGEAGRYELVGEVARGGMGAILAGRDVDLGRDLAIKVILDEHRDDPEMIGRFVVEAQIGGQLQHPGIVPVHELGRFPDGRLYIAMKLVRGRTLAELLEARADPAEDRPRFLSIFEQVCRTMAYAHARGVIHRDLKPSNVMVGRFGEVQVMDWGLAKVLEPGSVADDFDRARARDRSGTIRTFRMGPETGESRAGSVLGTPAYMAPEQARGAIDALDERADVFGLGSILCEVLTGLPAYAGRSGPELHRMAQRGDLDDARNRLDASGADAELIELARSCLAPAPRDRPRDAGAVLSRLSAYLEGSERRLRESDLARARAEALAAEERKRRVLTMALAASVLATGLLAAGGWAWMARDRLARAEARNAEVNRANAEVNRALEAAIGKRDQARASGADGATLWVEAIEAARRAESLLSQGEIRPELRGRVASLLEGVLRERADVEAAEKDRRMVERLAEIHNDLGVHGDGERADTEYRAAFRGYGVDLDALDPTTAGARLAASPAAVEVANALDQWAFLRRGGSLRDRAGADRLIAVAKAADPDPWRKQLRDTLAHMPADRGRAIAALERLADTADLDRLPEASVSRLAFALAMRGRRERAIALLRRTQRKHPDDFWLNSDLGRELLFSGRPEEAVRFFAVAVGIRPNSGLALHSLGKALDQSGQAEEAAATFRRLIDLRPGDAHVQVSLGAALLGLGDRPGAEAAFRAAKGLAKPGDWWVPDHIANVWTDWGDRAAALAERREAVRQQPSLSEHHELLGRALLEVGRIDEAVDAFRESLRLDPQFPHARAGLAHALLARGDLSAAMAAADTVDSGRLPRGPRPPEVAHFRNAEQWLALDARLPDLLRGRDRPADAAEGAAFAQLCASKHLNATAARLWADAFAARPGLADDPKAEARYQAARAAALAGLGHGHDQPPPDAAARARWRRQALDWLAAALTAFARRLEEGKHPQRVEVLKDLGRWRVDPALAAIRDEGAIAALPEAERPRIRALWARAEALLERARGRGFAGAPARSG